MTLCSRRIRILSLNQAGFTLVELLIGMLLGTIVVFAVGSVYVSMMRYGVEMDHQADLQQQGTLLQQDLTRRILSAVNVFPGACGPGGATANSVGLVFSDTTKNSCIYQNGTQIYDCKLAADFPLTPACSAAPPPGNLSSRSRAIVTTNSLRFNCANPPTCTTSYATGGAWVDVQFGLTAAIGVRPIVFATRVTLRN